MKTLLILITLLFLLSCEEKQIQQIEEYQVVGKWIFEEKEFEFSSNNSVVFDVDNQVKIQAEWKLIWIKGHSTIQVKIGTNFYLLYIIESYENDTMYTDKGKFTRTL